ncbi:ankyrin repeat domain-containing protein [Aspergillus mulundensis]|uniref:F-box domain-containing protein n=1 Tax=Aspergillus mulundensis TaxID=1810919 RepID=A0A3D8S669_9EURO|nr:hypothetical protein DSM5745_05061 [Aspergillus mulundensis]RDW81504.1 hypothetical protein DSM5745_05061 [Aspergillus mulundensis]
MPYSDLPNEIILHISSFFDLDFNINRYCSSSPEDNSLSLSSDPNVKDFLAWIRTSKRHAAVLTPVLLDHAFNFTPTRREKEKQDAQFRKITRMRTSRIWWTSRVWESQHLADYLRSRSHERFWPDFVYTLVNGVYKKVSLLEALIRVSSAKMLELLLDDQEFRETYLDRDGGSSDTLPNHLELAIHDDDTQIARILLNAGSNVRYFNAQGLSPLHSAAEYQSLEYVDLLLDFGADVWAMTEGANRQPLLPVEKALRQLPDRPEVANRLLDMMLQTEGQKSPWDWKLHLAHRVFFHCQGFHSGAADFVQVLIDSGVNLFAPNREGKTALETIEELGRKHCSRNMEEYRAESQPDWLKVAAFLLQIDPHIWPEGHINSQLWRCVQKSDYLFECQLVLLNLLVRANESALGAIATDGSTSMHYLCDHELLSHNRIRPPNDRPDYIENFWPQLYEDLQSDLEPQLCRTGPAVFRDSSPDPNHVYEHRFANVREMITILLDHGVSISHQNENGQTPLYLAARSPWHGFLSLLLRKRPNDPAVNITYTEENKLKTPLFAAIASGNASSVELLLRNGADVHATDHNGYNALHLAVRSRETEVQTVQAIIHAGCPVDDSHPSIGTALHLAAACGFVSAIEVLINAGCSPHRRNSQGLTPFGVALRAATCKRNGAAEELIRVLGGEIVRNEDRGSGDLVCMVLQSTNQGKENTEAGQDLARLLVSYGAGTHEHCDACDSLRKECDL